ncbi:MAG: hypothetical protein WAQ99_12350 [Pyrinomonadaceae bacterium]
MATRSIYLLALFLLTILSIELSAQQRWRLATARELQIARAIDSAYKAELPRASRPGPPGLFYRKVRDLPRDIMKDLRERLVDFIDTENSLENPQSRRFDIEIDGVSVKDYAPRIVSRVVPVFHQPWLKEGVHKIRITRRSLKRLVYDGEILVNNIDRVSVNLGRCEAQTDPCAVTVKKGTEVIFRGSSGP